MIIKVVKMVKYLAVFTAFFLGFNVYAVDQFCLDNPTLCQALEPTPLYGCQKDNGQYAAGVMYASITEQNGQCPMVDLATIQLEVNHLVYSQTITSIELVGLNQWYFKTEGFGGYYSVKSSNANGFLNECPDGFDNQIDDNDCRINTCNDGYYGDPFKVSVCDRVTPTLPPECRLGALNVVPPPLWPSCNMTGLGDLPDFPDQEPDIIDEPSCTKFKPTFGNEIDVCKVDPSSVCTDSGVCHVGCGYVESGNGDEVEFLCFGFTVDELKKPDFDLPDDNEYDPYTAGSCRVINGTSYCPQDENEHKEPDGQYSDGCGYVNAEFYCITAEIPITSVTDKSDFIEPLIAIDESDTKTVKVLSSINKDVRKSSNDLNKSIKELDNGIAKNSKRVQKSIENARVNSNARLDFIDSKVALRDSQRDAKLDSITLALGGALEGGGDETPLSFDNIVKEHRAEPTTFTETSTLFYESIESAPIVLSFTAFKHLFELSSPQCPNLSIDLTNTIIGKTVSTSMHCDLFTDNAVIFSVIMKIVFLFGAFRIFAGS